MIRLITAAILFASLSTHAQLVPKDAVPEKVADGYKFTEGPVLVDGMILFSDIPSSIIASYDPNTGKTETVVKNTQNTNGLFYREGVVYGCSHGARALVKFGGPGDKLEVFYDKLYVVKDEGGVREIKLNSPNDLVMDSNGGIYFTDPRYGNRDNMETKTEGVYYYHETYLKGAEQPTINKKFYEIDIDLTRPNGIVLSPDETILYVADNGANYIYAYDIESPGEVKNKRVFGRINDGKGGGSDGMTVDAQGRLYATGHGKVWVFEPTGQLVATIAVGKQTTNCTFGADGKTLYVTANKGLYRITLNTDVPLEHAKKE